MNSYLARPMIVSIISVAMLVVFVGAPGGGLGTIGMSPARVEAEKTHVKAIAIKKRFIVLLLLNLGMQELRLEIE